MVKVERTRETAVKFYQTTRHNTSGRIFIEGKQPLLTDCLHVALEITEDEIQRFTCFYILLSDVICY